MANKQTSATVAVIKDNKVLLLLRGPTAKYNPNKYGFPGGMLDEGENLDDCAVRELREETGISVNKNQLSNIVLKYESGHKRLLFLIKDDTIDSNIDISWEHSDYVWVGSSDIASMSLVPGVQVAIKVLCDLGYLI